MQQTDYDLSMQIHRKSRNLERARISDQSIWPQVGRPPRIRVCQIHLCMQERKIPTSRSHHHAATKTLKPSKPPLNPKTLKILNPITSIVIMYTIYFSTPSTLPNNEINLLMFFISSFQFVPTSMKLHGWREIFKKQQVTSYSFHKALNPKP